jgi:hypothetical protein
MSQFTAESITTQITAYDAIVRKALSDGDMSKVIELEDKIVSQKLCFFYFLKNKIALEIFLQNLYAFYRLGS